MSTSECGHVMGVVLATSQELMWSVWSLPSKVGPSLSPSDWCVQPGVSVHPSVWWPCYPNTLLYRLAHYSRRTLHLHVNMCHYSLFLDRSKKRTLEILSSPFKGTCPWWCVCTCMHMCVCMCVHARVCVRVYLCMLACTWWVYVSLLG